MRLILFDIDGTLIHANRAGRAALEAALQEVYGTTGPIESYQMAGKTDPLIIFDVLQAAGIAEADVEARIEQVYERMAVHGRSVFPEHGMQVCPGVPQLLDALKERRDVVLGLVTGNIASTAPLKLAAAGIDPSLFVAGAYGSDARDRNALGPLAIARACHHTGHHFNGDTTVIVGDTPADILCARAAEAVAVAVATGNHSMETLAQYNPDYLLESLRDTDEVLRILLEGTQK